MILSGQTTPDKYQLLHNFLIELYNFLLMYLYKVLTFCESTSLACCWWGVYARVCHKAQLLKRLCLHVVSR